MEIRADGHDGWIEVAHEGVHVLAKGDDGLRRRLLAALDAVGDESPADVLTDELTTGGVRRTPDFAIVDESEGRVLVRGSATVLLTRADGATHEVLAPSRGPWTDEDLDEGVGAAVLTAGGLEPTSPAEVALEESAPDAAAAPAPTGWAMPSVFAAPAGDAGQEPARPALSVVSDAPETSPPAGSPPSVPAPTPVEEALIVETPAPEGQDIADTAADEPAAPTGSGAPAGGDSPDEDEELPSFDFLFGNTSHHRSSLRSGADDGEEDVEAIDSGPVAAAGGFQPREDPTNTTLAPPTDDAETDGPVAAEGPSQPDLPGGLPPMPGSESPAVQAARDDAPGREPGGSHPQFFDGHLVGRRVPSGARPAPGAEPMSSLPQPDDDGMISSVPWADGGLPTPDHGPVHPVREPAVDTGEIPSGPMVLAVRCASGHHNAPHATRCRVCGQDLPTQQPEQTPRPALGLLRLSTGDVVTLDRGVLIGRAPRAAAEASGARAPHLVRIASPDNEISRNHVEIVLDGWHVLVRDLGSTNGTTVALPGSSPVRVRPGDQQTIEPGTTITLADQVSMVFEVTG